MMTTRTEIARQYAQSVRGRFQVVADEAGVGYQWLAKFAQGRIKDPSASKIDALLAYRDRCTENNQSGAAA